jgi:nitrilase
MNFADREHIALKSNGRLAFGKIRLAAVQAEPAFIDLDRSTEIACNLIDQAAAHGARLIGFPETFLPFFPNWYETLPDNSATRGFDKELFKNSVEIPGERACKRGRISAVVGVNERLVAAGCLSFPRQKHLQPRP